MSLLQEALKRKEQDASQGKPEAVNAEIIPPVLPAENVNSTAGRQTAEGTGNLPGSPPQSMPVAGQTQAAVGQNVLASAEPLAKPGPRKASFLWVIVAVIAIFAGLTITAGMAFLFYRVSSPAKAKTVQQAGHIDNPAAMAAAGSNISAAQLVLAPHPKPESAGAAEITASQSIARNMNKETTSAIVQNAETKSVQLQSAETSQRKPTPAKQSFFKPKSPPAVPPAAKWPALKLTGILRGTGKTESTAFINGKMVSAGQAIADVTVVEIQADGVILKYGDENKFLRVGAVSY